MSLVAVRCGRHLLVRGLGGVTCLGLGLRGRQHICLLPAGVLYNVQINVAGCGTAVCTTQLAFHAAEHLPVPPFLPAYDSAAAPLAATNDQPLLCIHRHTHLPWRYVCGACCRYHLPCRPLHYSHRLPRGRSRWPSATPAHAYHRCWPLPCSMDALSVPHAYRSCAYAGG